MRVEGGSEGEGCSDGLQRLQGSFPDQSLISPHRMFSSVIWDTNSHFLRPLWNLCDFFPSVFVLTLYLFAFIVHTHACAHPCHDEHMDVRGQLGRVRPLLLP